MINVSMFNSLEGIDKATLRVVNDKISEIKELSQNKILGLTRIIEELQTKVINFESVDQSLHALFTLDVNDIFKTLP